MGNFPSDNASLRWHYPNQVMGRSSQLPLSLYCKLPLSSILCSFMSDTMLNVSDGNVKLRIFHRNCAAHLDSAPLHLGRGFLHMRCRDRPQLRNAPRFRSAPSRSWLSPHALSRPSAIVQRTSIPLRFISVVAFATCAVETVRNCATHLDSASLHLGRGFRHMERKKEEPREMQALPEALPFSFPRCSIATRKKTAVPAAPMSAKTAIFKCAIRGSNPGHPD